MNSHILKIFSLLFAFFLFLCGCSDTPVATSPSIRVTAPASSSVVNAGTTCTITWSISGAVDNTVTIDLYGDTGCVQSVSPTASNSGSFSWPVPTSTAEDTGYRIKITSATQPSVFGYSGLFTIVNNTDPYEPDGSSSQATLLDASVQPQKHRISAADTDWFKFDATSGTTYCIQTHGNADTYLSLYATNAFTLLASNDNGGVGNNALVVWTCVSSGTYYFKVIAPSPRAGADYTIDIRSGGAILAITFPVSGTGGLSSGSAVSIRWAYSTNSGATVSLYALRSDTPACVIVSGANNGGSYSWTIPWTLPTSQAYRIKIVSDNDTSIHDQSDQFTITQIPISLTITTPSSSTRWNTGSTYSVYWTSSGNFGSYVRLDLYDSTSFVMNISSSSYLRNGSMDWTVPYSLTSDSAYRIKITNTTDTSIHDFSDPFTIAKTPSTLTITTPSAATKWTSGSSYSIYWTYTGNPGTYVTLALYDDTTLIENFTGSFYTSNGYCTWAIPLSVPTSSTYRLKITSTADTSIHNFSEKFTITKVPTALTLTTPSATTHWNTGSTYSIYWTYTGNPGTYVTLSLWDSASSQIAIITSAAPAANGTYSWLIPPTIASGNYRIKMASAQDTTIYGFSALFTITNVPATITVTTPGASTVWNTGAAYSVYWSYTGSIGTYVTISLYNDSTFVQTVNSYVLASYGGYQWTIPSSLQGGGKYRIKVASYTYPSIAGVSPYFTLMQAPSRLTITTPVSSSSWNTGSNYYVYWTSSGAPGPTVKIDLYDFSAFVQSISSGASTSTGYLSWLVPSSLHTNNQYQIRITSTTQDTVSSLSGFFTITNIPSGIAVTAPATGDRWNAGLSYAIDWSSSGAIPGSYVSISLVDSSGAISSIVSSVYRTYNNYSWPIPLTQRSGNNLRVRVASTTDTTIAGYSGIFTIIPAPPHLTVTAPDTATSWLAGYSYTIYWSYSGSPGTSVKLDLYDSTALVQTIASTVYTTNGSLLWFVPSSLHTDNNYRVKITSLTSDTVFGFSRYFQIVNSSIGDSYEPDSTPALAKQINAGAAAQSHTLTSGDKDWFSFSATAGTTYTMETFGSSDTYMNLFSTDGATLISSNDDESGSNTNSKIIWTCTVSGMYYFEITGSYGAVGNYTVSLN
jgi:hypothetical protein